MKRGTLRTLPVPLLLTAAGFTLAIAQDAPPGPAPQPPAPKPPTTQDDGGAAPAPPAAPEFKPPAILAQRRKGLKEPAANAAIAAGLDWLRRHHGGEAGWADDGRWDCDGFDTVCTGAKCSEPGESVFDPGVTGLATLAFLGAGSTHIEGSDAAHVAAALTYLRNIQDSEGCFGPRTSQAFQYNHRIATMAVAEALWLTGDEKLIGPASKARDFVYASQNPYLAWRYGMRDGDNDTSNSAYAVIALRTAEFACLDVDRAAWVGAREWFDKMTDPETGQAGYQRRGGTDARPSSLGASGVGRSRQEAPPEPEGPRIKKKELPLLPRAQSPRTVAGSPGPDGRSFGGAPESVLFRYPDDKHSALTAAAAAATSLTCGADAAALVDRWAGSLSRTPPSSGRAEFLDLHYMLFGSLFHAQRPLDVKPKTEDARKTWRPWREAVVADLTHAQRKKADGCAAGSWDASQDPFGFSGGRVYATAMAVLALEAPNRFPKVWNPKRK